MNAACISASADAAFSVRIPPDAPAAPHHQQRYFSHGKALARSIRLFEGNRATATASHSESEVEVYRVATSDRVELISSINCNFNFAEVRVLLTAAELRDLSARLLDAAYDLDTHPASSLVEVPA